MWKNHGDGWRLHDRATGLRHVCELTLKPKLQSKTKKESSVDKNIAALMRHDARTVHVVLSNTSGDGWNTKHYTYVSHLALVPGDQIVVPVNDGTCIALVKKIDDTVKIEPNSDITYKWVITKIDMAAHEANMQRNKDIESMVADAYRESLRASFSQRVLESMDPIKRGEVNKLLG